MDVQKESPLRMNNNTSNVSTYFSKIETTAHAVMSEYPLIDCMV